MLDAYDGNVQKGVCDVNWPFALGWYGEGRASRLRPAVHSCFRRYAIAYFNFTLPLFRSFLDPVYHDDNEFPTLHLATHTLELGLKAAYETLRTQANTPVPATHNLMRLADAIQTLRNGRMISGGVLAKLRQFEVLNGAQLRLRYPVDRQQQRIAWFDADGNPPSHYIPMGYYFDSFVECWSEIEQLF